MTQGIYSITHAPSGRVYVGQSRDIDTRIANHLNELKNGKHRNRHLQATYNLEGQDLFQFAVLEVVDDLTMIFEREIFWAEHLQAMAEHGGFNIAAPGQTTYKESRGQLRWAIDKLVGAQGKTIYALSDKLHGKISRNTLYKISRNETDRTDLKTLEVLTHGLTDFLGVEVGIGDLFEIVPDPVEG